MLFNYRKLEREKDRISLAVSVISKLGGMPTSTQIANWAFEEADETQVQILKQMYTPAISFIIRIFKP